MARYCTSCAPRFGHEPDKDSRRCAAITGWQSWPRPCSSRRSRRSGFALMAYVPMRRIAWRPRGVSEPLLRSVPLFNGFMLLPSRQARARELHFCRGVPRDHFLLENWAVGDAAVMALNRAENSCLFEDVCNLSGDQVGLTDSSIIAAVAGSGVGCGFRAAVLRAKACVRALSRSPLVASASIAGPNSTIGCYNLHIRSKCASNFAATSRCE